MKSYIAFTYQDDQLFQQFETANKAAIFFSSNLSDSTLDQKRYPDIFNSHYCETDSDQMHLDQPYLEFKNLKYQFYSIDSSRFRSSEYRDIQGNIYTRIDGDYTIYYFKDSVVDLSNEVKSTVPNYANYSKTFYSSNRIDESMSPLDLAQSKIVNDYEHYYRNDQLFSSKKRLVSQKYQEFLKSSSKEDIRHLLNQFIEILDTYKVSHNLTTESWMRVIFSSENFEVQKFIRKEPKTSQRVSTTTALELDELDYEDINNTSLGKLSESQKYIVDNLTDLYIRRDLLHNIFENIDAIKNKEFFGGYLQVFIWISVFIASIIFSFRITDLRSLLFSILTVGILILIISLTAATISYMNRQSHNYIEFVIGYLAFLLGTIILLIPIAFSKRLRKSVVSICLNISIVLWPLYLMTIVGIIAMHQQDICESRNSQSNVSIENCTSIISELGLNLSWILFIATLIFMYFYTSIIKHWKALPEG